MPLPRPLEAETHLRDSLRVLSKHRWLITLIFLVAVVTTAIWTFRQQPIYRASAIVLIEPEPPRILNIQEVQPIGAASLDYYQTQYEIIRSRPVMERVIETMHLKQRLPRLAQAHDPALSLLGSVSVEPRRGTRLVAIRFEDADPVLAAQVANGIAASYTKYNLDIKLKGARDALSWLSEEMGKLRGRVEQSSEALQNYRVKSGILGLHEQRQITAQKIMDFNKAYLDAQAQRLSIEAKLHELDKIAKDKSGAQTIFIVADNQLIRKMKEEEADLEVQKSKLLKTYKPKHPEVLKIEAQLQQVNLKIDAEIQTMLRAVQTEYKVAKAREETLLTNVNQLRREGQDLNEKEIQYLSLQRESDSNQQLYEAVLKRLKETGVTGAIETNNVSLVEEATPPQFPIRPRKKLNLALSVGIGLLLGASCAFLIEYFDTTVKSPDDVERYFGLPVIAIVPKFSVKR